MSKPESSLTLYAPEQVGDGTGRSEAAPSTAKKHHIFTIWHHIFRA